MSKEDVTFSNPDCLPVEHVSLDVTNDGVFQKISALDSYWVEPREFIVYVRPPSGSNLELGAIDEWKNNMEGYLEDVKWLLSLEYYRFWSTIIYHNKCMDSLVSYLQEGTPPYMPPHDSKDVQNLCTEIRKYVLRVFSRLITNKESKSQWMTKEYMSDLIYNHFIFTIPILWDICLLYGIDNKQHVSRLVNSVFKLQPNYEGDVKAAVSFINESFKYIILQVNKDYDSVDPPNLPETFKGFGEIRRPSGNKTVEKLTFSMLKDLVLHLLDTAMTLRIFVEIYSKCVKILRQVNFVNSMVQMYEHGVPQLYAKLEETGDRTSIDYTEVEQYIDLARSEFIDIFKEILLVYKNAIFNDDGNKSVHVEDYLAVMMDALSEKLFIRDYHAAYPVHEDIELLREACPNIDTVKTDFILQAIYSNLDDPLENSVSSSQSSSDDESDDSTPAQVVRREKNDDGLPDVFEVEALIKKVKDVLPHLGDGFILKCIKVYGLNSDRIINVVLENNLDDSLKGEDQTLPIIPDDPLDKLYLETGYDRLNVFDGDEFDFKVRDDIDMSRIHFGKRKPEYKDVNQMLNDKTEVKLMSGIFNKYSLITDEEALYDDEYDDTGYDGIAPPAPDEVEHQRRPFVTPRALRTKGDRVEEEESQDDSEVEEAKPGTSNGRNRLDFCVNPEEVRARREANMQLRSGRGRGARAPPAPKTRDVVGKPKGQGQEKEVLANRDKKEKHKSSRANHNRRQGAQWKRSQGMMPS